MGECIARGELAGAPGEGCSSLAPFIERLTRDGIGMPPLLAALADIVLRGARPAPILKELVARLPVRPARVTQSGG